MISPDVLATDRERFEATGDENRRDKVGGEVGRQTEVMPHIADRT
jgi:hypothetical protein